MYDKPIVYATDDNKMSAMDVQHHVYWDIFDCEISSQQRVLMEYHVRIIVSNTIL